MTTELLSLHRISKSFDGASALMDVNLTINEGEIHCIVGENGAGKSTLMKIVAGVLHPDNGIIKFKGESVRFKNPKEASDLGVSIVFQEPMFFPFLSVLENIYFGDELLGKFNEIRWKQMADIAKNALLNMGLHEDILKKPMSSLSIGTQQLVLIARAIHKKSKLLILDEPTSILSNAESDILFRQIETLSKNGLAVLYISHRMDDILGIGQRISVLRDGKLVNEFSREEANRDNLVVAMSGRILSSIEYNKNSYVKSEIPLIEVKNLTNFGSFENISFSLSAGEILGIYGLVGSGRSEVARAIIGEDDISSGVVLFEGIEIKLKNCAEAMKLGITYSPEDRRRQALFPNRNLRENITAGLFQKIKNKLGIINSNIEEKIVNKQIADLNIKTESQATLILNLSGGNQQKAMLSRGILHQPKVLILDEPTRGIDVGTKVEIHNLINNLAKQNIGIIMISSDLPEILALSDRILIMREGKLVGEMNGKTSSEIEILHLALGSEQENNKESDVNIKGDNR